MAKEYIERETMVERLSSIASEVEFADGKEDHLFAYGTLTGVRRSIIHAKSVPAADVVEVKHGYWIPSPDGINPIRCSECNVPAPFAAGENEFGDFEICRYPSSYCHECGAKMDGEKKTE